MKKDKKIYYFLYRTTNLLNNKYYLGMHSTRKLKDGYLGSGKILRRSINKYGQDNFKMEILYFFNSRSEMVYEENRLINEQILKDPLCMNIRIGGFGGFTKEEQIKNAIKSNLKQKYLKENNEEWVLKKFENQSNSQKKTYENGREKSYFYDWNGKKHKEETKIKISEKLKLSSKGESNSQFGTCWITKDNENKKIKKEELEDYLKYGWIKGRKL